MSQNKQKLLLSFLPKISLFSSLNKKQIKALVEKTHFMHYAKNKEIFKAGDKAKGIYIILLGSVKLFQRSTQAKEQIVHIKKNGETFGEAAMFEETSMPVNATTLEKTTLCMIPKQELIALIQSEPKVAFNMLAMQAKRLRLLTQTIENLMLKDAKERLARYLLKRAETESDEFILGISQTTLATLLGLSRETLSRLLADFQKEKMIALTKKKIKILNIQKLKSPELKKLS